MPELVLRSMTPQDVHHVAGLICDSTNAWYRAAGKPDIFTCGPAATRLFCDVYEDLDPGCCVVAEDAATRLLIGSCFYHPRPTHVSLGIMNVHPAHFGRGVARKLLTFITDFADARKLPVRLVSSAMNLDSFSLYTRAGFAPRAVYQDMYIDIPPTGLRVEAHPRIRPATPKDAAAMANLEMELSQIHREADYRYFLENRSGIWHASVLENDGGGIDGFLVSVNHSASNMLGPGVMRSKADALALILAELTHHQGRRPVFLVPADQSWLVQQLYGVGAKNCELHFCQVRGAFPGFSGIAMPTFMPETG